MRTRAAVALKAGAPLEVMEVELDGPKAGEVLVEMAFAGMCHSDEHLRHGPGVRPIVGGHEGSGVVQAVGAGVTSVAPGDHVITTRAEHNALRRPLIRDVIAWLREEAAA